MPWVSTNAPQLFSSVFSSLPLPLRRRRRRRRSRRKDDGGDDDDDRENDDDDDDDETRKGGLVIAAQALGPLIPFLPLWIVNPLKITQVCPEGRASGGVPAHAGQKEAEEEARDGRIRSHGRWRSQRQTHRPRAVVPGRSFSVRASTCSSHVLAGAESFSVFLSSSSSSSSSEGDVWYEVASFSRPATALSALTLPLVRTLQARFREESARAVVEAVERGRGR